MGPPLVGFLLPRAQLRRVPVSAKAPVSRNLGGAGAARTPPVPSSGILPLSTVSAAFAARTDPLQGPPLAVTPRRFAALFHAARALELPFRAFFFRRAVPDLSGLCFLAGSSPTAARRGARQALHDRFHPRAAPLAPDEPGRRNRDVRSPQPPDRAPAKGHGRPCLHRARRLVAGTPASKPCSPRKHVPFCDTHPGQGEAAGPLLSWDFPSAALAPADPWSGVARRGSSRGSCRIEGPVASLAWRSREPRARDLDPLLRARRESIGSRRDRQAATQRRPHPGMDACARRPASALLAGGRTPSWPAPPFGGARRLPHPSPRTPARGARGWIPETTVDRAGGPTSREASQHT